MKMVVHQAIRVNLPAGLAAGFAQSGHEPFPVKIVIKDRLAAVAAIHHVINRSGILNPQLPGHSFGLATNLPHVKARTDPFMLDNDFSPDYSIVVNRDRLNWKKDRLNSQPPTKG
jgi:hypothetical protein